MQRLPLLPGMWGWHAPEPLVWSRMQRFVRLREAAEAREKPMGAVRFAADRLLLGIFGEWVYSQAACLELDLSDEAAARLHDGGQDFPGVDVKATPHPDTPVLLRPVGQETSAPHFALVAVKTKAEPWQGRYCGYATAEDLLMAPLVSIQSGMCRCLPESALVRRLPPDSAHR